MEKKITALICLDATNDINEVNFYKVIYLYQWDKEIYLIDRATLSDKTKVMSLWQTEIYYKTVSGIKLLDLKFHFQNGSCLPFIIKETHMLSEQGSNERMALWHRQRDWELWRVFCLSYLHVHMHRANFPFCPGVKNGR